MYPRCYVGDVVEASKTDDGLAIKGGFIATPSSASRSTETPRAAECQVCIGYAIAPPPRPQSVTSGPTWI